MKHPLIPANFITILCLLLVATGSQGQATQRTKKNVEGRLVWNTPVFRPCTVCEGKKIASCAGCNGGRKKLPHKCLECRGRKKAACRICFGVGATHDPFLKSKCIRCDAKGWFPCPICNGSLGLKSSSGKIVRKCPLCKKKGGYPCSMCRGERMLSLEQPGGKPIEQAPVADLEAMKKRLRPAVDAARAFLEGKGQYSSRHFEHCRKKIEAALPLAKAEFKALLKLARETEKKSRGLGNPEGPVANLRRSSMNAVFAYMQKEAQIVDACLDMHKKNSR